MRLFRSPSRKTEAVRFRIEPAQTPRADDGLALVVLVRNEARFLEEWLRFHAMAGVSHFILYDDGSTDDTVEVALKTLPNGMVRVIPWAQRLQDCMTGRALHNQGLAFSHAISNFRRDFRWMGFIDVDEYLFPTKANSIPEVLARLDHADTILLPWHMFGRQGLRTTPSPMLPNYQQRHHDTYTSPVKGVLNFKCLVNPVAVRMAYVHGFETGDGSRIWNSNGQPFAAGAQSDPAFHADWALQLNHYYARSDADLDAKIEKGSIGHSVFTRHFKSPDRRSDMLLRRVEEIERHTVEDRGILDFCARAGWEFPGPV